jgi:Flp pilus assembly protein TadD
MSTEGLLREAVSHQQAGRVREALRLYESILADQPEHPQALNLAGVAHAGMGNSRRAIGLLRKAANVQPGDPEVH